MHNAIDLGYHEPVRETSQEPEIFRVHPVRVAIDEIRRGFGEGDSCRGASVRSQVIAAWLSNNSEALSAWYRSSFVRDFRSIEKLIEHGSDLERRIGVLGQLAQALDSGTQAFALHVRDLLEPEHAALLDVAKRLVMEPEFLTLGVDDCSTIESSDAVVCLDRSMQALRIAKQGFLVDRDGWEVLHTCVERACALARLAHDDSILESLAPLSVALFRCRGVARLIDWIESTYRGHCAADRLTMHLRAIMQIRLLESERALALIHLERGGVR